ncbi:MAG TPA: GNAT family N-acetyltransferase [Miltoncostaea sp.]|nr:GNAT family N-acetyltransferase [Miltoncostaea sp.]
MPEVAAPAATADHLLLFNRDAFHALNLRPGQRVVRIDHHDGGRLVGSLVGVRDGDVVSCGHSAPFGGPDLVRDAETAANVCALLARAVGELDADGVRTVRVKARPAFYSGSETTVQFALLNLGFRVEACDLSFHIDLDPLAGIDDYVAMLRSPARRALRHGLAEPFALREAADEGDWAMGYGLLAANRAAKGRTLALDAGYVRAVRDAFPGRIRMAILEHAGVPCAAALTYRVMPARELVVYWGDAGHELPRSPMNVLAHALVARSLEEGVRSLDTGPSSIDGVPDQGLIQFKRSIGAREDLRLYLVREAA